MTNQEPLTAETLTEFSVIQHIRACYEQCPNIFEAYNRSAESVRAYAAQEVAKATAGLKNENGQLRHNEKQFEARYKVACDKKEKFQRWYEKSQQARKHLESGNIDAAIKLLPLPERVKGGL